MRRDMVEIGERIAAMPPPGEEMAEMSELRSDDLRTGRGAASLPPIRVPTHGLTRYQRVRLGLDDGLMWWELPRSVLGLVPVGVRRVAIPLADLRSLHLCHRVRPVNFVIGLASIALPIALWPWWVALPLGLGGLAVVVVSLGPSLDAATHGGRTLRANVCFGHELDAELYMAAVQDLIEEPSRS